jgi:uncharacterized protein YecE (DUF72 family)
MSTSPIAADAPLLHVGCAGWSLARHDRADFPEEGSHLERYAAVFNATEINSSFYRPHHPATYARWAQTVPQGFRFAVKLPRTITHERRLADSDDELARFAGAAGELGPKLAWLLVQLPPSFAFEAPVAARFFAAVRRCLGCAVALEARHASWFTPPATALQHDAGVTRVVADPPAGADVHLPTTDAFYIRLHGAPRMYYSSYADAYLDQMAAAMRAHAARGHPSWCIFDNTAGQAAVPNALTLVRALQGCPRPAPRPPPA